MKTKEVLENQLMPRDSGGIAGIATQIASAAAAQYRGPKAKEAAEAAANKAYSVMLKTIDDYFNYSQAKDIN